MGAEVQHFSLVGQHVQQQALLQMPLVCLLQVSLEWQRKIDLAKDVQQA